MKNIVFVVYDGIENSVFQSQVLQPILNDLQADKSLAVTVVSFELDVKKAKKLCQNIAPNQKNLKFVFLKRVLFFGKFSLSFSIFQLKKWSKFQKLTKIVARGPLAGYVALRALPENIDFKIQARGLCAEEYRYSRQKLHRNWAQKLIDRFIFNNFSWIERFVYSHDNVKIEAVSRALKDYLVAHFGANPRNIVIAVRDVPKQIDSSQKGIWRQQVRDELGIPENAIVYCYSGSFRPWQCASQTIHAFWLEYTKNSLAFMLILTQDIKPFELELKKVNIPESHYKILTVNSKDLYKYLCAANFGMLLREPDVINWVSRPTKMLEYQVCGLSIIHNNTVAWLTNNPNS